MSIAGCCRGLVFGLGLLPFFCVRAQDCMVAADSGAVSPPLLVSNGCLIQEITGPGSQPGLAAYRFSITNSGSFVLQALVAAPRGQTNSLSVNIDAEPDRTAMVWEVSPSVGFSNQLVFWSAESASSTPYPRRKVFNLGRGEHRLFIGSGTGTVQIARIAVLNLPPPPNGLRVIGPGS